MSFAVRQVQLHAARGQQKFANVHVRHLIIPHTLWHTLGRMCTGLQYVWECGTEFGSGSFPPKFVLPPNSALRCSTKILKDGLKDFAAEMCDCENFNFMPCGESPCPLQLYNIKTNATTGHFHGTITFTDHQHSHTIQVQFQLYGPKTRF